ncbi:MAG: Hsp20/alpha crystallin family protein [Planctomycetes bacterium]|nr:Hsp20/alpha crystallin family protein [Planctomycetota bacterium]
MTMSLTTLRRRPLTSVFDEMFDELMAPFLSNERRGANTPAMNIVETSDSYRLAFELPGVKMEDVSVQVDEGQLVVSAERRLETEKREGDNYHRVEHRYGRFARSISLPKDVQADRVDAVYRDGVLTVTLKKQEPSAARHIEIRAE